MRSRPLAWLLLSLLFFAGAFYFWRLGDKWAARRGDSSRNATRISRHATRITHHASLSHPPAQPGRHAQFAATRSICHATRNAQHEPLCPAPEQHHATRSASCSAAVKPSCSKTRCSTPPGPHPPFPTICAPRAIPAATWSRPAGRLTTPSAPCCKPPGPPSFPTSRTTPIWSAPRRRWRSS